MIGPKWASVLRYLIVKGKTLILMRASFNMRQNIDFGKKKNKELNKKYKFISPSLSLSLSLSVKKLNIMNKLAIICVSGCRNRIRMYPAFVNCTTIDWFSEWPADALLEVADKYLSEISLGSEEEVTLGY